MSVVERINEIEQKWKAEHDAAKDAIREGTHDPTNLNTKPSNIANFAIWECLGALAEEIDALRDERGR